MLNQGHIIMGRATAYLAVAALVALVGAYVIYAVWEQLILSELVLNRTLAWFPTVAVLWGSLCILGGGIYAFRSSHRARNSPVRKASPRARAK